MLFASPSVPMIISPPFLPVAGGRTVGLTTAPAPPPLAAVAARVAVAGAALAPPDAVLGAVEAAGFVAVAAAGALVAVGLAPQAARKAATAEDDRPSAPARRTKSRRLRRRWANDAVRPVRISWSAILHSSQKCRCQR